MTQHPLKPVALGPTPADSELSVILAALEQELVLYLRTGMRVSEGRLILWMHEVRLAAAKAAEGR